MLAANDQEIRISGDSHVSEPPDLWQKEMPLKYRDRALRFPRVEYGVHNHSRAGGWDPKERLKDMAADSVLLVARSKPGQIGPGYGGSPLLITPEKPRAPEVG